MNVPYLSTCTLFNAVCSLYIRSLLWVPDTLLSVLELGILIYKINTHKCVHTHTQPLINIIEILNLFLKYPTTQVTL